MKTLLVNTNKKLSKINKNIYGHFAEHLGRCIYGGIFVGEDSPIPNTRGIRKDVVEALKNIKIPVVRWPGGCFAEYYNWKDGIGKLSERKRMVNTAWGGVVEDNSFGTHEFLDFCEQVGCSPYIAGNVGSGTVRELSEWIEYVNSDAESPLTELRKRNGRDKPWGIEFIGVGNENWGCGGRMTPGFYASLYKQFATYIRPYGGTVPIKVACGADGADYKWTSTLMKKVNGRSMSGLSLHYYTMPGYYSTDPFKWEKKSAATGFDEANYYRTINRALYIEELVVRHKYLMDQYDPEVKISMIVDEWGAWHSAEEGTNPRFLFQQNTMRDAIVAAVSLNIFNNHSDRVHMANLAQMINVIQSVILTEGDQMVLTPTYHVFDLYKGHQDATLIESYVQKDMTGTEEAQVPCLNVSASEDEAGKLRITIANLSAKESQDLRCIIAGREYSQVSARHIAGDMNAHNQFGKAPEVEIKALEGIKLDKEGLTLKMPACSVAEIVLS